MRTIDRPGFHAEWDTSTWTWRRARSTETVGAGLTTLPLAAFVSTPVAPWTVRKYRSGELTPAPNGQSRSAGEAPITTVSAATLGSSIVVGGRRNAADQPSGLTRDPAR